MTPELRQEDQGKSSPETREYHAGKEIRNFKGSSGNEQMLGFMCEKLKKSGF